MTENSDKPQHQRVHESLPPHDDTGRYLIVSGRTINGYLMWIGGPMFSGKSGELIRQMRRWRIAGKRIDVLRGAAGPPLGAALGPTPFL